MKNKSTYKVFLFLLLFLCKYDVHSQWAIFHVTVNNTDSRLNTILLERQAAVIATTASYETILNSIELIATSLFNIRTKEYLTSNHDKRHTVGTLLQGFYATLLGMPALSPSFFPLYSTAAKREYFANEIGLIVPLLVDINVTGRGNNIRNANTQELYLLRKEMFLNLKKVSKNPKRVYGLLFGIALLNNLIYPEMDPNLKDFLFNHI